MEVSIVELTDIITLAGVAGTIGILLNLQYRLQRDISSLRQDINRDISALKKDMNKETGKLRERMVKIEDLFEGFVKRESPQPGISLPATP